MSLLSKFKNESRFILDNKKLLILTSTCICGFLFPSTVCCRCVETCLVCVYKLSAAAVLQLTVSQFHTAQRESGWRKAGRQHKKRLETGSTLTKGKVTRSRWNPSRQRITGTGRKVHSKVQKTCVLLRSVAVTDRYLPWRHQTGEQYDRLAGWREKQSFINLLCVCVGVERPDPVKASFL